MGRISARRKGICWTVIPSHETDSSADLGAGQFKVRSGSWGPGMATMRLDLCWRQGAGGGGRQGRILLVIIWPKHHESRTIF